MNAHENITSIKKATPIVAILAAALCVLGAGVIFTWHTPNAFGSTHQTIINMAYNTAICIMLSGASLIGLLRKQLLLVKVFAIIIGIISGLTLLELLGGLDLNVNYWFISKPDNIFIGGGLMSPTTALCLVLLSISLLLFRQQNSLIIPIVFLNLITLTITLIAMLGHGIGLVPAFVWLGIKMAPHTAVALCFFTIAIIIYIYRPAIDAFNQLNFFKRIVTGFGFMAVLVIAIGSIAFMQIHTVSALTHELYEKPLQINIAVQCNALKLKSIPLTVNLKMLPFKKKQL